MTFTIDMASLSVLFVSYLSFVVVLVVASSLINLVKKGI